MAKIIVIESHGTGFYHEAHAYDCVDITRKLASWGLTRETDGSAFIAENLVDAKSKYEANNDNFDDGGWNFNEHCKLYPCATKAGA